MSESESSAYATEIDEIREKLKQSAQNRRKDELQREVASCLSDMKSRFEHYENEQALKASVAAQSAVDNYLMEVGPPDGGLAESWKAALSNFAQAFTARVVVRQADEMVARVRSELLFAEDHLSHHREAKAVESLQAARAAMTELIKQEWYTKGGNSIPSVQELNRTFGEQCLQIELNCTKQINERESSDAVRKLESIITEAEDALSHSIYARVPELLRKYEETKTDFEKTPRLRETIRERVAPHSPRLAEIIQKYREAVLSTAFIESVRETQSLLDQAVDAFSHFNYSDAITHLESARDRTSAIGADRQLAGYEPAEKFIKEATAKISGLQEQLQDALRRRSIEETQREIASTLSSAQDHFEHNQDEDALTAAEKMDDLLTKHLSLHGGVADVATFCTDHRAKCRELVNRCAERAFGRELARRQNAISAFREAAKDALSHHQTERAMDELRKADEEATALATDPRFLHLPSVDEFLAAHRSESSTICQSIESQQRKREVEGVVRQCSSELDTAQRLVEHHCTAEALQHLSIVEGLLEGDLPCALALNERPDDYIESVKSHTLPELRERLKALVHNLQTEQCLAEAKSALCSVRAALENAEFLVGQNRIDDATRAISDAQTAASILAQSRFAGIELVTEFFSRWPQRFKTANATVRTAALQLSFQTKKAEISSMLSRAASLAAQNIFASALDQLDAAKSALEEMTSLLSEVPQTAAFVAEKRKELEMISTSAVQKHASDAAAAQVQKIREDLALASHYMERMAYTAALAAIQTASAEFHEMSASPQSSRTTCFSEFARNEWKSAFDNVRKQYALSVLASEGEEHAAEVRAKLGVVGHLISRNLEQKALDALAEVSTTVQQTFGSSSSMLSALPVASAVLQELKLVEQTAATTFLLPRVHKIVTAATPLLEKATTLVVNQMVRCDTLLVSLREVLAPLLGTSKTSPVAPQYLSLPQAQEVVQRACTVFAAASAIGCTVELLTTRSAAASQKGGDAAVAPVLKRLPLLPALRKGLPMLTASDLQYLQHQKAINDIVRQCKTIRAGTSSKLSPPPTLLPSTKQKQKSAMREGRYHDWRPPPVPLPSF